MTSFAMESDLYELTMAQVYFRQKRDQRAVFEFFTRPSPKRGYYLFAGLEILLKRLQNFEFLPEDLAYLHQIKKFDEDFLQFLHDFRFQGNIWAMEEGEIFFSNEPILQVEASLIEAQLIETLLINTLQQTILVATKALRCYSVARDTKLVDFGLRRAHGIDAGLKAAYAAYIGGFLGTSNLHAGKEYNIPVYGTMAHSFVQSFVSEKEAFKAFLRAYPKNAILLVDTYDTIKGVQNAIEASKETGIKLKGIRIDSGNLIDLTQRVRRMLDTAGFKESIILVSGGIDEYRIDELLRAKAPIDSWGVGTKLVVSEDLPSLDCAYKLVAIDGRATFKKSPHKVTLPYKKQVFRHITKNSFYDEIGFFKEGGLLKPVMDNGQIVASMPSLEQKKQKALQNLQMLPEPIKDIWTNKEPKVRLKKDYRQKLFDLGII